MAEWLDTFFYGFDHAILGAIHDFAVATNGFFTPFMHFISLFADKAICMFLLGMVLMLFAKSRRTGACVFLAVCIGAVFTNLLLKQLVARARPYADEARALFEWWQYVGAPTESDHSFPSGHTTATAAAMTGLFLTTPKKYSFPALFFILLMGFSRMYLVVHYPTDVLGGLISGVAAAVLSYFLTRLIFRVLERHAENRFCTFCLHFDLIRFLRRRKDHSCDAQ